MAAIVYLNMLAFNSIKESGTKIETLDLSSIKEILPCSEFSEIERITVQLLQVGQLLSRFDFHLEHYDNTGILTPSYDNVTLPTLEWLQDQGLELSVVFAKDLIIVFEQRKKEETNNMLVVRPLINTYESSMLNILQVLFATFSFTVVKTKPQFKAWFTSNHFTLT
jgi:hypothetical protein